MSIHALLEIDALGDAETAAIIRMRASLTFGVEEPNVYSSAYVSLSSSLSFGRTIDPLILDDKRILPNHEVSNTLSHEAEHMPQVMNSLLAFLHNHRVDHLWFSKASDIQLVRHACNSVGLTLPAKYSDEGLTVAALYHTAPHETLNKYTDTPVFVLIDTLQRTQGETL